MLPLRKSMLSLHIISKILCTGAFSLKSLRPSKFGTMFTICQAFGYCIFHVWTSRHNMSQSVKNMVRQLIDTHNQYCGLCAFCFLVIASLLMQSKIVRIIQNLEDVDRIFQQKLSVAVDNRKWRRWEVDFIWWWNVHIKIPFSICVFNFFHLVFIYLFILYRNVLLQICICISALTLLEWRNCLMYIQDSVPFSEYCLMICLGLTRWQNAIQ